MIGDYGPAASIYPNGQVDPAHNSELELRLTNGSFRLSIAALNKKFVRALHEPIYPKICTDLFGVTGTTPIVAGSGTGAYRGSSAASRPPSRPTRSRPSRASQAQALPARS